MKFKKLLLLFLCCISVLYSATSYGQNDKSKTIQGTVSNDKGARLAGVSVVVKQSKKGTTTDDDGKFSLAGVNEKTVITFSSGNYSPLDVTVGSKTTIEVTLREAVVDLDEVVVVGYGTSKRKDLTGAVASANVKDMQKAPVASFVEALAGRVPGVTITGQDGQPGGDINVIIRGNNSLTQDNSPLYVIDGFPIENYNNSLINPAEIESIEVLKDASATAIYGARGANGVILITSKKGKEGPPVVSYQYYYGLQDISKKIPMLSAYEFVKLQLEINPRAEETYLTRSNRTLEDYKNIVGVDMQDRVFRQAGMQSHYINLSGGSAKTKYTLSGNLFDQDGIITASNFKRHQFRGTLDQQVNNTLKVGTNFTYTTSKANGTVVKDNSQTTANGRSAGAVNMSGYLMYNIWSYRPVTGNNLDFTEEMIDPGAAEDYPLAYPINPYMQVNNELRENLQNNIIINAYVEKQILKKLKFRATGGINRNTTTVSAFNNTRTSLGNPRTTPGLGVNGSRSISNADLWVNENTLTYSDKFFGSHKVDVLVGATFQGAKTNAYGMRAVQLPNEDLGMSGLDQGTPSTVTARTSEWSLASFLGRINYSFNSKYLLTVNFRADGTSRFAEGHKWAYFPSASAAWRFSEEGFMKNVDFINDAKFRAGYGVIGNNRVTDFAYLSTIGVSTNYSYSYNNQTPSTGSAPTALGNEALKWESTASFNAGLDLTFFKKRVNLTVDAYHKTTSNLLLNAQLPRLTGYSTIFKNVGKVQNKGLEFALDVKLIDKKDFSWNSGFNISFNKNKVLYLQENQESILSVPSFGSISNMGVSITKVGYPLGMFYGHIWDGVYQYDDFDKLPNGSYALKENITTSHNSRNATRPGDVKYRDLDGDLVTGSSDYTMIGNPNPVHTGGFINNFAYKNFDLSVFMQWSYGNDILNVNRMIFEGGGSYPYNINQYATAANRWSPTNTESTMPRYYNGSAALNSYYSTRVVEDGSYLRFKTLSFGYTVPKNMLKRVKLQNLRLYFAAQNLYTFTKYTGYDPEVSTNYSALTQGIDYSAYPRAKTMTLGLNVSF
jgi:TonB-linked SusC/RagA family outer membrane protein